VERLSPSRPRCESCSEGRPKRPLLLREITNPFIFFTGGTACLNRWAVALELDARTHPPLHDVAKSLHNVTKNKVMELWMEALSSQRLALKSFPNTGNPARRRCPAEGAAARMFGTGWAQAGKGHCEVPPEATSHQCCSFPALVGNREVAAPAK